MSASPCVECHERPKFGRRQRCLVCFLRSEGITERVDASRARLAAIPPALRRKTVPARLWPPRTRWCAGCQSFVDVEDVPTNGSMCRACVGARSHAATISKTYGIDTAEYERLFALQGGKCAICRAKPKKKRLAVDHNHKSGAVRGLLCARCNHDLLGAGWDSVNVLMAAVNYLDTPPMSGHWRAPESLEPYSASVGEPDPFDDPAGPEWERQGVNAAGASSAVVSRLGLVTQMTEAEFTFSGGSRDESGQYRIYHRRGDPPPF